MKVLRAVLLMVAVCAPAMAGDIPIPPGPPPSGGGNGRVIKTSIVPAIALALVRLTR